MTIVKGKNSVKQQQDHLRNYSRDRSFNTRAAVRNLELPSLSNKMPSSNFYTPSSPSTSRPPRRSAAEGQAQPQSGTTNGGHYYPQSSTSSHNSHHHHHLHHAANGMKHQSAVHHSVAHTRKLHSGRTSHNRRVSSKKTIPLSSPELLNGAAITGAAAGTPTTANYSSAAEIFPCKLRLLSDAVDRKTSRAKIAGEVEVKSQGLRWIDESAKSRVLAGWLHVEECRVECSRGGSGGAAGGQDGSSQAGACSAHGSSSTTSSLQNEINQGEEQKESFFDKLRHNFKQNKKTYRSVQYKLIVKINPKAPAQRTTSRRTDVADKESTDGHQLQQQESVMRQRHQGKHRSGRDEDVADSDEDSDVESPRDGTGMKMRIRKEDHLDAEEEKRKLKTTVSQRFAAIFAYFFALFLAVFSLCSRRRTSTGLESEKKTSEALAADKKSSTASSTSSTTASSPRSDKSATTSSGDRFIYTTKNAAAMKVDDDQPSPPPKMIPRTNSNTSNISTASLRLQDQDCFSYVFSGFENRRAFVQFISAIRHAVKENYMNNNYTVDNDKSNDGTPSKKEKILAGLVIPTSTTSRRMSNEVLKKSEQLEKTAVEKSSKKVTSSPTTSTAASPPGGNGRENLSEVEQTAKELQQVGAQELLLGKKQKKLASSTTSSPTAAAGAVKNYPGGSSSSLSAGSTTGAASRQPLWLPLPQPEQQKDKKQLLNGKLPITMQQFLDTFVHIGCPNPFYRVTSKGGALHEHTLIEGDFFQADNTKETAPDFLKKGTFEGRFPNLTKLMKERKDKDEKIGNPDCNVGSTVLTKGFVKGKASPKFRRTIHYHVDAANKVGPKVAEMTQLMEYYRDEHGALRILLASNVERTPFAETFRFDHWVVVKEIDEQTLEVKSWLDVTWLGWCLVAGLVRSSGFENYAVFAKNWVPIVAAACAKLHQTSTTTGEDGSCDGINERDDENVNAANQQLAAPATPVRMGKNTTTNSATSSCNSLEITAASSTSTRDDVSTTATLSPLSTRNGSTTSTGQLFNSCTSTGNINEQRSSGSAGATQQEKQVFFTYPVLVLSVIVVVQSLLLARAYALF
ncbi:unnamed protein product [Amoebophrya sp. A120]|nr:unnamed protein product [Amoebophrya sp. A120]|eukprot:GSA120T00025044001.1